MQSFEKASCFGRAFRRQISVLIWPVNLPSEMGNLFSLIIFLLRTLLVSPSTTVIQCFLASGALKLNRLVVKFLKIHSKKTRETLKPCGCIFRILVKTMTSHHLRVMKSIVQLKAFSSGGRPREIQCGIQTTHSIWTHP